MAATRSSCFRLIVITDDDCAWIESAFDQVIGESHRVPGAIWSLGKTLIENAMAAKRA